MCRREYVSDTHWFSGVTCRGLSRWAKPRGYTGKPVTHGFTSLKRNTVTKLHRVNVKSKLIERVCNETPL